MKLQNSGEDDLGNKLIESADVFINKVPAEVETTGEDISGKGDNYWIERKYLL